MIPVVIIGAGIAGIAAGRALLAAGIAPLVLDKGRGIGGRMATRRITLKGVEVSFDHGAQYLSLREAGLAAALATVPGAQAVWHDGAPHPHIVGLPGMSGLARALARGLEVRQGVTVTGLARAGAGWRVETGQGPLDAARLIVTVPAPQLAGLLGADHPVARAAGAALMAPCLTLMAAFPGGAHGPFVSRRDASAPLAFIAQDSSKPGRAVAGLTTWVAQAGPEWSHDHLEEEPAALTARMLPLLCAELGVAPEHAAHAASHRWRHARVTRPLGQPYLQSPCGGVLAGGDWCLGPRVEAAWQSGDAMARAVLDRIG